MNSITSYKHLSHGDEEITLPVGKVVCIGRNYMAHINELKNEVPEQSLYFMKPADSLVSFSQPIEWPSEAGSCHHELEIAVLISQKLTKASLNQVELAIWGYGLALDLTLRDLQTHLKQKGQPWERAKAFDGSCPVSQFVHISEFKQSDITFSLAVNGHMRQQGNTANMLLSILEMLMEISHLFTLNPGDVVLTGTPEGVSALQAGDELSLSLDNHFSVDAAVGPGR
jgi:2-keto-4-pentenoate hydratase/2-oxohepta-3-ene-1,7-dioic acid hydratase in catechol pathway